MKNSVSKAMILAAGRGERMKPLTDVCPKPLLKVNGTSLIARHLEKFNDAGIQEVVVNHAWLGEQIEQALSQPEQWQVSIRFSAENKALETAGGIVNALPLLNLKEQECFLVVNGDVFTDFSFKPLPQLAADEVAHLFLVDNPEHNPNGDFAIEQGKLVNISDADQQSFTYSGIALFKFAFFQPIIEQVGDKLPLAPLLRHWAEAGKISASVLKESWTDVGTPERLAQLNQ